MLKSSFFLKPARELAKNLLGKKISFSGLSGIIVETEAYEGFNDPGSHIYKGITNRNKIMLEEGGTIYIYLCCGLYYMFNIVADKKDIPGAVLIRALEPLEGIEIMQKRRKNKKHLTDGPGKWTQAFGVNLDWNGKRIEEDFSISLYKHKFDIVETTRIGIKDGADLKLRFYIKGNPFISKN